MVGANRRELRCDLANKFTPETHGVKRTADGSHHVHHILVKEGGRDGIREDLDNEKVEKSEKISWMKLSSTEDRKLSTPKPAWNVGGGRH